MIKIENVVLPSPEQWQAVIRGMRNPKNSWEKSDSYKTVIEDADTLQTADFEFYVGENDLSLMKTLVSAGSAHAKYKRMIWVYADVTAPMYWWKEFDTYTNTVRNSCSTMHKLTSKPLDIDDFSHEKMDFNSQCVLEDLLLVLNRKIDEYKQTNDKQLWDSIIQLLPSSYNQRSTIMMNYETLSAIYRWRKGHKLTEWHTFCDFIKNLPYSELILGENEK